MTQTPLALSDYPLQAYDKLRYADTDRQGHVNNAVFSTMLETGRVELLYTPEPLYGPGCTFVIASMHLDFRSEVTWPGRVDVGTRVASIGKSSMTLEQGIFQGGKCVATGTTVIVQMNEASRRSHPLSDKTVDRLRQLLVKQG